MRTSLVHRLSFIRTCIWKVDRSYGMSKRILNQRKRQRSYSVLKKPTPAEKSNKQRDNTKTPPKLPVYGIPTFPLTLNTKELMHRQYYTKCREPLRTSMDP